MTITDVLDLCGFPSLEIWPSTVPGWREVLRCGSIGEINKQAQRFSRYVKALRVLHPWFGVVVHWDRHDGEWKKVHSIPKKYIKRLSEVFP